jgi:ABC-type multidrug transport system fused ATPase/permease subunit
MVCNTFLINTVVQAALLGYGTYLVRDGLLQPTVLLAFMLYQGQLQEYFQNLFNSFTSLLKSSGAAAKVFEYVERRPRCRNASAEADSAAGYDGQGGEETTPPSFVKHTSTLQPGGAAQGSRGGGHVAIRDVHFCYPSRPEIEVLCGFSLEVPAGKSFALVGPSGNGKSTVFALLKRFYEPQSGVVTLDGVEVSRIRSAALHRQIALVSQEPVLMSGTIESNITYSLQQEGDPLTEGSVPGMTAESVAELRRKVVAAATAANAHCFVSGLKDGYGTQVGERGVQLSGGQRQRIAIARSLLQDPLVLLLDEATSALDSESESMVQEALERAMVGRTTLVIAHRLSTVRNADQLAFMNGGRVVEMGTHDELMAKPLPPEGEDEEGRRRSGPTYRQHVRLQTAAAALPTNGS